MSLEPKTLETKALGALGVEITGIDLRDELTIDDLATLRRIVSEEGLVLIREQPLSRPAQVALGRRFGTLEALSTDNGEIDTKTIAIANVDEDGTILGDDSAMMQMLSINEGWHTDSSFRDVPASFSLFSAVTVPKRGGDTFFASLHLGWDALSSNEQAALYGLRGIHDYVAAYRSRGFEMSDVTDFEMPTRVHPIARRHPETGRTGLYITEHMSGIEGMSDEDSSALLAKLLGACTHPERIYRHRWTVGDMIIWDNRSMLHRAQGFESDCPRVMCHVRVAGDERVVAAVSSAESAR